MGVWDCSSSMRRQDIALVVVLSGLGLALGNPACSSESAFSAASGGAGGGSSGFGPCTSDDECTGSAAFCDATRGVCVQCVQDGQCGEEQACEQGRCRSLCSSDAECDAGLPCDVELGLCVECVGDGDCDGGYCDGSSCRSQVCSPGSSACTEEGVRRCTERGDAWGPIEECPSSCTEEGDTARCDSGDGGAAGDSSGTGAGSGGAGAGGTSGAMGGTGGSGGSGGGATGGTGGTTAGCERAVFASAEFTGLSFPIPPPYDNSGGYATWSNFGDEFGEGSRAQVMSTYAAGLAYSYSCVGAGYTDWGGGCILIMNGQDVAALGYDSFEFWARATTPVELRVSLPDRNSSAQGGVCDDAPAGCLENCCNDHYGIDVSIGSEWALYRYRFDELGKIDNNGPPGPFDATYVRQIDLRTDAGVDFEFFVDDIAFSSCKE